MSTTDTSAGPDKLKHKELCSSIRDIDGAVPMSSTSQRHVARRNLPSRHLHVLRSLVYAYFSVQGNRGIEGLILVGLKIVRKLNVQNTELRGPIVEDFYDITLITLLNLNNLDFSRSKELDLRANLPNVKVILLLSNVLFGPMLELLGQNSELSVLDVSQNSPKQASSNGWAKSQPATVPTFALQDVQLSVTWRIHERAVAVLVRPTVVTVDVVALNVVVVVVKGQT
ncbi:hypothetical protein AXG93_2637s1080 [Marchantia polymorpha subsp. ruderalis]|uniref:Leucine-rich repeat-containing N-terminal plant-type domain-containing protein n=1 Tax=Marchantia polymorpha subsp. ruderalis TaxID=1480154 RepID=A0A176VDW3_MARPO|nr:hypothetical protein AXG93_2637s1080 [Marchantia polymorpha subsp. ruderalis]